MSTDSMCCQMAVRNGANLDISACPTAPCFVVLQEGLEIPWDSTMPTVQVSSLLATTQSSPRFFNHVMEYPGLCEAGYYCPEGSSYARENHCGAAKFVCPEGSSAPQLVEEGYFSVDNAFQELCPPGFYCKEGLRLSCPAGSYNPSNGSSSVHDCLVTPDGFYSKIGSVSPIPCGGVHVYCPKGSTAPIPVDERYFSWSPNSIILSSIMDCSRTRENCTVNGGLFYLHSSNVMGAESQRSEQRLCPKGHFCVNGNRFECPPGTYGEEEGLQTELCSGKCWKGFYCPAASTSPTQLQCNPLGNESNYCPAESGYPIKASHGYYVSAEPPFPSLGLADLEAAVNWFESEFELVLTSSTGTTTRIPLKTLYTIASVQIQCPEGSYCQNGLRHKCPAGSFGDRRGLSSPFCR